MFWDTSDPYHFLRIDNGPRQSYAIFGGEDHKTGQESDTERRFQQLERTLQSYVDGATVDRRWSGQVVETNDGLPFIGEIAKQQFIATGFAGNGITLGTVAAMMAADAVMGRRNPWQELFDVGRKKLRGGTWDYVKENVDFPYYLIRDRVARRRSKSLRAVKRGQGAVVDCDGQLIAASRDADGTLSTVSAVCTHLGCLVHWNEAERTWDCPCHGSRFHPNGEVLAGPAEAPLERVEQRSRQPVAHRKQVERWRPRARG